MQFQIRRNGAQLFLKSFIAIKPERLSAIKRTRDDKEGGRYSELLQLRCYCGRVAPFTVVKCKQAERSFAGTVQAFGQLTQLNEIEPAAKHFDMAARLLPVQDVFIDDDTSGLEMTNQSKGNSANSIQHSIARSINTRALRPRPKNRNLSHAARSNALR